MTKHMPESENENGKKPGWWQRFRSMPDAQRAEILAKISVWAIIALLYILGGVSLYLRARYLPSASPTIPLQTATPTKEPATSNPTETLYPTRTPRPADTSSSGNVTAEWVFFMTRDDGTIDATI
ncbi:MAG: hypothetical protein R6V13_03505 [Anaerolineae bacterium]